MPLAILKQQLKTKDMTKQELIKGQEFSFENDVLDTMEVSFSKKLERFIVWFNGRIVADPKTFKTLENRVLEMKNRHNLTIKK